MYTHVKRKRAVSRFCTAHQGHWIEFVCPTATMKGAVDKVCRVCRSVFPHYRDKDQLDLDLPTVH